VRTLLISTYDLGRQPLGLALPAAWLRAAGLGVECVDVSRDPLDDAQIGRAGLVAFYLPMHTATRLAAPLVARVRRVNPAARVAAYGLYAPLNADWLRLQGVEHVFGPEAEEDLVALASLGDPTSGAGRSPGAWSPEPAAPSQAPIAQSPAPGAPRRASAARRLRVVSPDRSTLPALARYARLQMPDGSRRIVGTTEATRGCKHVCRHCPIVPVYEGVFRAVPIDAVLEDIRAQIASGAQHISFGDPDFLNGPTHARRLVERVAREWPQITYDVTIKIEHILSHADMLGLLRDTGCLIVTSAVESVDDAVLDKLRKGHTRADFVKAVGLCRQAGVTLAPTFVPFSPWTTIRGYVDLLVQIDTLGLAEAVAPIQLAIRLLVTANSKLLELPDIQAIVEPFEAHSLTFPWRHADPRVDELQRGVMQVVGANPGASRSDVFRRITALAREAMGSDPMHDATQGLESDRVWGLTPAATPPHLTEAWYCCAEPGPEQFDLM